MCGLFKPQTDFAFRSLATGERQGHCRSCHAAYRRQHYLAHRDEYIAREVARMAGYRRENRLRVFEYLLSHTCVDCGEADPVVLEFDHRDPATKRSEVARLAMSKSWKVVSAEIAKCDVRCGSCHRRRTAIQQGWAVRPAPTPLLRIAARPPDDMDVSVERACSKCHRTRPLTDFPWKVIALGRRGTICKPCMAAASRAHYYDNRGVYLAKAKRNRKISRARNRNRRRDLMALLACVDCGEDDPLVLEFDHRDGTSKLANVGRLMATASWRSILEEIAKCDVRCVNCHRRRTAVQFGWTRSRLANGDR